MSTDLPALTRLRAILSDMGSVVVAYSGGVDSSVVATVGHQVLGSRSVALLAVSETLPPEELVAARRVSVEAPFSLLEVDAHELLREGYAENAGNRCYFCKSEIFELAERERVRMGFSFIADGTLMDDLGDVRPGLRAASERQVRHPLVEAGIRKSDVREIARNLGLSVWDKPAFACLGSRFPVGTRISETKLKRVAIAESALRRAGFRQFRVRWHELDTGVLARVEVDPSDIARLAQPGIREQVVEACTKAGFQWVTLDLNGFPNRESSRELPKAQGKDVSVS